MGQHGQTYMMLPKYTSTLFISGVGLAFPKREKEGKMGKRLGPSLPVLNISCWNCSSVHIPFSLSPNFILHSHGREKRVHSIPFSQGRNHQNLVWGSPLNVPLQSFALMTLVLLPQTCN